MNQQLIKERPLGGKETLRRLWLQGQDLSDYNWQPGRRFDRVIRNGEIVIKANPTGRYVISRKGKSGRSAEIPVLDIQSCELTEEFSNCLSIRLEVDSHSIVVRRSDLDKRIQEREDAFIDAVSSGTELKIGSGYHGGGVLDSAMHEGFEQRGLSTAVSIAIEIDSDYLQSSRRNNRFWADDAIAVNSPIELMMMGDSIDRKLHILTQGLPCTGASKAGKSKLKLKNAEDHEHAGSMFLYTLQWITKANPAIVVFECVTEYATSSSWSVVRAFLTAMGYNLSYREFTGNEFGALEDRKRMVAVAVSRGLDEQAVFDIDSVTPRRNKPKYLIEVLDPVADDSTAWKEVNYLKAKSVRDKNDGKGFALQFLNPSTATKVGCIGRGYSKYRSTEPMINHPSGDGRIRLLSPAEHARVKTIPEHVVDGLGCTKATEILGQSVIYEFFHQLGDYIARWATTLVMGTKATSPLQMSLIQ